MSNYTILRWILAGIAALTLVSARAPRFAVAADLPTVEVGLPEDGVFGLGGQYIQG